LRCPKCKTYNHDKARFCINCGVTLSDPNISKYILKAKYITILLICVFFVLFAVVFLYFTVGKPKQYSKVISLQLPRAESNKKLQKTRQTQAVSLADSTTLYRNDEKLAQQKFPAGTREALFKEALSIKESSPLKSLVLISKGICLTSALPAENISDKLKNNNIIKVVQGLITELSKKGYDKDLAEILTPDVLINMGDVQILISMVYITSKNYGYGTAIQFVERVQHGFHYSNVSDKNKIGSLVASLYQQWLTQQINANNIDSAESIYDFAKVQFPSNPEINIAGIEIALKQGNWEKAELLLDKINYPDSFSDKIELLENQISELKGQAGKIVIRFTPGSKHIPVQGIINGKVKQNFVIDTGASFVTIPTSTVKALGIRIDQNAPVTKVSTAGGVKNAREIVLKSITLDRCNVNNIKVLVLDIPGQPKLGLLGLNFLHYFHMEINNKNGTLLLKPR